jgi:hypothetical protein
VQAPAAGGCWPGPAGESVGLRWCWAPQHHCCCCEAKTPARTAAPAGDTPQVVMRLTAVCVDNM